MTHNINQQKLIQENEILGKIILEIMLKNSTRVSNSWKRLGKTNEEIDEFLNQPDWKEKSQFEAVLSNYNGSECITHKWTDTWLVNAREPIEIIEKLSKEKEEALRGKEVAEQVGSKRLRELTDKEKENKEQALKIDALEKDLEEKELIISKQKEQIAAAELDAEIHLDAVKACEDWFILQPGCIKEQLNDKVELLQKADEKLMEKETEIQRLEEEDERKTQMLIKADEKAIEKDRRIEELETQLSLNNKPLPKTPSKFKVFKEKAKTKFHHSIEKIKHQSREFVARIEVKVK